MKLHRGTGTSSIESLFLGSQVTLRVLVADKDASTRQQLMGLLEAHSEVFVIAQAKYGCEASNINYSKPAIRRL